MKLAFVYAGQGSQKVGMGEDLYKYSEIFKNGFDKADPTGKYKALCFEGPMEELSQTENTQPCLVAFAVGVTEMLSAEGIKPEISAGLSLGEYSALYGAGVWDAATTAEITAVRGRAMKEAVTGIETAMAAVMGIDREILLDICKECSKEGVVQIANYNCPGQLVISGEAHAVAIASEKAKESGARRVIPLTVSGPFHTTLMSPAGDVLKTKLEEVSFGEMAHPVVFNTTAKPLADGENIKELLIKQVQTSVNFEDSVRYMAAEGIDTIIEVGPGKALSGFIKKIAPEIKTLAIEDVAGYEAAIAYLKGE